MAERLAKVALNTISVSHTVAVGRAAQATKCINKFGWRTALDGWFMVRQKGSHRQFHHPSKSGTDTVAGKASVDIPPGTLNSILKQAGIK